MERWAFRPHLPPDLTAIGGQKTTFTTSGSYQTTHCFLMFSEYIAPQRVRVARSLWPGFLFGLTSPPKFRVLSVIHRRKGPICPAHDPEKRSFEKIMRKQSPR